MKSRFHTPELDAGITPRFTFRNGLMDVRNLWSQLLKKYKDQFPARTKPGIVEARFNAIKFGKSGGVIRISPARINAAGHCFIEVAVIDQGPGVASHDRDRIFEPYVRAARDSEAGGLGLGLAICRRIVEAHGGAITASDEPGGGSRFSFTLPAVVREREAGC